MGRPSKPLISREAATRAALQVIDDEGLDGFSLGAVAKRMNVKARATRRNSGSAIAAVSCACPVFLRGSPLAHIPRRFSFWALCQHLPPHVADVMQLVDTVVSQETRGEYFIPRIFLEAV